MREEAMAGSHMTEMGMLLLLEHSKKVREEISGCLF